MAAKINGRNKGVGPSLLAAKSIIKTTLPVPNTIDATIHFMFLISNVHGVGPQGERAAAEDTFF